MRSAPRACARSRRNSAQSANSIEAWTRRTASRAGDEQHGARPSGGSARRRRLDAVRRLDRPHRGRRAALRQAGAAAGRRAQRRDQHVGLVDAEALSARRDLDRQAQSDGQRQRPDLRIARGEHRHGAGARSGQATRRSQIKHPYRDPKTPRRPDLPMAAVAVLGRRADLGRPHQHPQPDDGREGPRVVHRAHPAGTRTRTSARQGSDHPSAKVVPLERLGAPALDVRSEDAASGRSSTPASRRTICISPRTRTTRCGPAPAARRAASSAG